LKERIINGALADVFQHKPLAQPIAVLQAMAQAQADELPLDNPLSPSIPPIASQ
jgi:hypothetical protein